MKESTNKGFTLVELVVAIAVLSFLLIGIGMFMTTGSRLYAKVYYKQEMLTESQLLMAQINDRAMDCNAGIAWDEDNDILYIVQKSETVSAPVGTSTVGEVVVSYQIHQYKLDGTDVLYKSITQTATQLASIDNIAETFAAIDDNYAKLAEYVENFDVDLYVDSTGQIITSVEVTTGFAQGGEEYEGSQLIHMRNQPIISTGVNSGDIDELVNELLEEAESGESEVAA